MMSDFIIFLQQKGLSKSTQAFYCYQAERFLHWYNQDALNATTKDVLNYLDYLQNTRSLQNITRRVHLISIHHYFEFIGHSSVTAFIKIQGTKKRKLHYIYSTEQLTQLYDNYHATYIQNADPNNWRTSPLTRWRNYVMLGCLVFQGLHTHELDVLNVSDIDFIKATIRVQPKGKRGNVRTLTLEASQIGTFMYYLQTIRPQLLTDDTDKLFLPSEKYPHQKDTDKQSIMPAVRFLHKTLKPIDKDYRKMTQLRASVITHWIKNHGLRKAQVLAGHKSIVSTQEYEHNDLESLTNDITQFNPF